MARRSSRRTVLGAMGFGVTTAALPAAALSTAALSAVGLSSAASSLPPIVLSVLEDDDEGRPVRLLRREVPPLATQALWAGATRHLVLRWDAHLPWQDEEEGDDAEKGNDDEEKGNDDEEKGDDDEELAEREEDEEKDEPRRRRGRQRRRDGDEEIVELGAWPLPGSPALAKALDALAPEAPPLVPARGTHERPVEAPEAPVWLSVTFALRRLRTELALGTLLVPQPLTTRLATTEGAGLRLRWSTRVEGRSRALAEAALGRHEAFARLPYREGRGREG